MKGVEKENELSWTLEDETPTAIMDQKLKDVIKRELQCKDNFQKYICNRISKNDENCRKEPWIQFYFLYVSALG